MFPWFPIIIALDQMFLVGLIPFSLYFFGSQRFRPLDRSVHSALMERVEEKLNAQWAKAQLNRQLTMHSLRTKPTVPHTEEESPAPETSVSDTDEAR